jgi:hypothetical protein
MARIPHRHLRLPPRASHKSIRVRRRLRPGRSVFRTVDAAGSRHSWMKSMHVAFQKKSSARDLRAVNMHEAIAPSECYV